MIENGINGKIVFVSSTLGLMGMIGYSQYSPTKFALRGLAECLRQELLPHKIDVSIYFVGTINSPGFIEENKSKPEITKILEEGDITDTSPQSRAKKLIKGKNNRAIKQSAINHLLMILYLGLEQNQFFITSDLINDLFRVSGSGISPWNGLIDPFLLLLCQVTKRNKKKLIFSF
jgi:3-dehydrosphinganine reductase